MTRTLWTWAAYVAVATVATTTHATNAVAQPPMLVCGINCMLCGPEEWGRQGWPASPRGGYAIFCTEGNACGENCGSIGPAEAGSPDRELVEAIRSASSTELARLVEEHGSRLLLHEPRRLLAIRGTACATDVVTTVVFLSSAETKALVRLRLGRL